MAWNTIEMKESIISENGKEVNRSPHVRLKLLLVVLNEVGKRVRLFAWLRKGKSSVNSLRFLQTPRRMKAWEGMTCRAYDDDN